MGIGLEVKDDVAKSINSGTGIGFDLINANVPEVLDVIKDQFSKLFSGNGNPIDHVKFDKNFGKILKDFGEAIESNKDKFSVLHDLILAENYLRNGDVKEAFLKFEEIYNQISKGGGEEIVKVLGNDGLEAVLRFSALRILELGSSDKDKVDYERWNKLSLGTSEDRKGFFEYLGAAVQIARGVLKIGTGIKTGNVLQVADGAFYVADGVGQLAG